MSCAILKRSYESIGVSDLSDETDIILSPWMDPKMLLNFVKGRDLSFEEIQPTQKKQRSKTNRKLFSVPVSKPKPDSYQDEIMKMMHSFGDVQAPFPESADVLENIVKKYLEKLLKVIQHNSTEKASKKKLKKGSVTRKNRITVEAVLKAIPPNKQQRAEEIIQFIRRNRMFEKSQNLEEVVEDEDLLINALNNSNEEHWDISLCDLVVETTKRSDFSQKRLMYRDQLSKQMNTEDYLYFTECSKVSFTKPNKKKKFMKWSGLDISNYQCSNDVIDLLGYLLYDCVEDIITQIKTERIDMIGPILPSHLLKFVS